MRSGELYSGGLAILGAAIVSVQQGVGPLSLAY